MVSLRVPAARMDTESPVVWPSWCYSADASPAMPETPADVQTMALMQHQQHAMASRAVRKRRLMERGVTSMGGLPDYLPPHPNNNNNNNSTSSNNNITSSTSNSSGNINHQMKNERLSPGTGEVTSRSGSVTPSSLSHPGTPPGTAGAVPPEMQGHPGLPITARNYSEFMRTLAARYNNANPNEFFTTRNGFPPPLDPRFKPIPGFPSLLQTLPPAPTKESEAAATPKKPDPMPSILNPFAGSSIFPPLIDMSSTQALISLVKTAREAEIQGILRGVKRQDSSSPLDLSSAGSVVPSVKRQRTHKRSAGSPGGLTGRHAASTPNPKRSESESPKIQEDVSHWSVEDVCNFVGGIDICAEYVPNFREQRIDGSGLPLLTEEHLTQTMNMKLGPALKLRSILAKKVGSCSVCLHCTHCHNSGSPEPSNTTGNTSDSGGAS